MWLRASSRLAPSLVTAPCDATAGKTRDVSNRFLPPKRTACTRTSSCSRLRAPLSWWGFRTDSQDPCRLTGGPEGFTTSETASADTHFDTVLVLYCLTAWRHERGRFLPTAPTCDRASDIPVTEPRSPSRLARLRERCIFAECPSLEGVIRVGECDVGQARRSRRFVKSAASFRSRMPSTGRDPS